ncbi:alanine--tRNA ligase [Jeotgalibaca sp. MA1X17-3]|uniref:alanine--tRNA ligase n=1 Tax=Jeotgalibaca sp. MA1X17-3 TaxID=2908211 RepID=UPI001F0078B9|nr:alanine--tRNA ligase [Jeotgalibaca sp. MA1X17-3]UJF15028.1 alanine--tRNA ligase [Jeotgalibaca sp. MA1X17-3]
MKNLTSNEIRQMFLEFWASKGHKVEPSASLVPINDPTLLWINSGVATLKKYFDGTIIPENPRITNAQKSIRTNDIENVGVTARHHTLFEMLGNFSIGDYFKEDAIPWAWEFLTSPKWMAFDPELLYVTYYPEDESTKRIWLDKVKLTEDHVVPVEDNFWDIGAGPCGPDTEIFYDRGKSFQDLPDEDPEMYPGGENERYLEIWNLVFSEYNHQADGSYEALPHKNVDTGMGLERVVSIVQDAPTNFETDLFMPIIKKIETLSDGTLYGQDKLTDVSFKVIADHIRAVSFAIGDRALPSNEGRGYILRRLIRRSVMHGQRLGIKRLFLNQLVPVVADIMKEFYPEVKKEQDFIIKVVSNEEQRFQETIHEGQEILQEVFEKMSAEKETILKGKDAFKLYDTYGFPLELTEEYAEEKGFTVDEDGFNEEMQSQRNRARAARQVDDSFSVQSTVLVDIVVPSDFVGFTHTRVHSELSVIVSDDELKELVEKGDTAQLIFQQTPFYAEMGGQVADHGIIQNEDGEVVAKVTDVKRAPNGQNLHKVEVYKEIRVNEEYTLLVEESRRRNITKNHTATHLLHQALKDVLGTHANQAGSLVTPEHLRFDFTHFGQATSEELVEMERVVNQKIWDALQVETIETTIDKAKEMGAMALFGEKYGKEVRLVQVGDYSLELCGGVHVQNTQDIGLFKITSESGIGAGVRRIEAVTGQAAYEYFRTKENELLEAAHTLKVQKTKEVTPRIQQLKQELKNSESEKESLKAKWMQLESQSIFDHVAEAGGVTYITYQTKNQDMNALRQLADQWKQKAHSDVFVAASELDGKVSLLAAVSKEKIKEGLKAGDLIKEIAPLVGGGGGGRPDMAQAGGKNPAGIPNALKQVSIWLSEK